MISRIADIGAFFRERAEDLKRIARQTRGDVELGDVQNEAWIAASELGKKRGYAVDFSDYQDQEALLSRLYGRFVRFAEKHFRYGVKLDTDWDREESTAFAAVLARILTAPASSNPEARLQQLQEGTQVSAAVAQSYSQAAAYVLLLMRFDWEAVDVARHLKIATTTLRLRLRRAGVLAKQQPSLFDRICSVDPSFRATIGKPPRPERVHLRGEQWAWSFQDG